MKNNDYLEEWFSETQYLYMDVFDDNFATSFERVTNKELVKNGILEIPSEDWLKERY